VLDRYEENRVLVDLTAQPQDIRDAIDAALLAVEPKSKSQIGTHIMKFCGKYELIRLSENVQPLAEILGKPLVKETEHA
jgi:hypothetical protein